MSSEPFANETALPMDPLPAAVAVDATADPAYTTPVEHRPALRDLSRLAYIGGRARATVRLNQSTAAGTATLRLTDGNNTLQSWSVDLTTSQHQTFAADVDLSGVAGASGLRFELSVDTAADADTTAEVAGVVHVSHPLVLLSGCG